MGRGWDPEEKKEVRQGAQAESPEGKGLEEEAAPRAEIKSEPGMDAAIPSKQAQGLLRRSCALSR